AALSGAGTGKGLLIRATSAVGNGTAPRARPAGHSAEELDKRLVAAAISGQPSIFFDNLNGEILESDTLAVMITEDPAEVRILGTRNNAPLHSRALIVLSGNAVPIAEDIARRVLQIGLDARMENPEQRPFKAGYLQGIFTRRTELMSACLTIWRWGVQQGEALPRGRPLGSFPEWARWCRDPLLALGCRDPVDRVAEIKNADPRRRQIIEVFSKWWGCHQTKLITAVDLHLDVKELIDETSKRGADGVLNFSRQRLAKWLR